MIESVVISWNPSENAYLVTILNTNLNGVHVEKFNNIHNSLAFLQTMADKDDTE